MKWRIMFRFSPSLFRSYRCSLVLFVSFFCLLFAFFFCFGLIFVPLCAPALCLFSARPVSGRRRFFLYRLLRSSEAWLKTKIGFYSFSWKTTESCGWLQRTVPDLHEKITNNVDKSMCFCYQFNGSRPLTTAESERPQNENRRNEILSSKNILVKWPRLVFNTFKR